MMEFRRIHFLLAANLACWASFGAVVTALFMADKTVRFGWLAITLEIMLMGLGISGGLRWFYVATDCAARPIIIRVLTACTASSVGGLIWWAAELLLFRGILKSPAPQGRIFDGIITSIVFDGMPLLAWSCVYFAIEYWLSWNDQEARLARASTLAQSAQLQMLRYQLNPHFLFNTLNSIRALIDEDAAKAGEMISELSGFLRYSLENEHYADVPLRIELQAVEYYFAIQKKRYEDKLQVNFDIDPKAREARVLSFLVHPLIENAVKFGMQTSPMPLKIGIDARVNRDILTISVRNTGTWIAPADAAAGNGGTSTGLENVRQRLECAHPGRHVFHSGEKEGWVCVQMEMPFACGGDHEIAD